MFFFFTDFCLNYLDKGDYTTPTYVIQPINMTVSPKYFVLLILLITKKLNTCTYIVKTSNLQVH